MNRIACHSKQRLARWWTRLLFTGPFAILYLNSVLNCLHLCSNLFLLIKLSNLDKTRRKLPSSCVISILKHVNCSLCAARQNLNKITARSMTIWWTWRPSGKFGNCQSATKQTNDTQTVQISKIKIAIDRVCATRIHSWLGHSSAPLV